MWVAVIASIAAATSTSQDLRYEAAASGKLPVALPVTGQGGVVGHIDRYEVSLGLSCRVEANGRRSTRVCRVDDILLEVQCADPADGEAVARTLTPLATALRGADIELKGARDGSIRAIDVPFPEGPVDRALTETHEALAVLVTRALAPFDLALTGTGRTRWLQESDQALRLPPVCSLGTAAVSHRVVSTGASTRIASEGHATMVDPAAPSRGCRSTITGLASVDAAGEILSRAIAVDGLFVIPMDREVAFRQTATVERLP